MVCPGGVDTPLQNTVEIFGVDKNSKQLAKMEKMFSRHAIYPDRVAGQIFRAMKKKRFMVITSEDVGFVYFCKHHIPPQYRNVMFRIAQLFEYDKTGGEVSGKEADERNSGIVCLANDMNDVNAGDTTFRLTKTKLL